MPLILAYAAAYAAILLQCACATRCGLPTYLIRWAGLGEDADTYELELNVKRQDNWADLVKDYKLRARQFLEVSSLPL